MTAEERTAKESIVAEMEAVPEPILTEVLDFLRFLKATRLPNARTVTVVSSGGEREVALEALKQAIPEIPSNHLIQTPIEQVRRNLIQALSDGGYHSKDAIVELVRDVKREMMAEREDG